ncbi:MAG: hypothetical protein COS71_02480 [Candidatus Moranbacteria bacterium CG06_land_8_20_14_3_00_40_12]|nr:MAG: hypothetical protein COX31_01045 [Candidatus Moranbacteria bacterium CG23_combo_of_CG06-09_8_20_14_all_40_16]PIU80633.1 MAG: hypothetical protein COS71_02480 [Candidatus Moranbacteria bacterium CG06_land_8_20_14_3_00_40_12]
MTIEIKPKGIEFVNKFDERRLIMASLLRVCCLNCSQCCPALQLNREMLQEIRKENEEIYEELIMLKAIGVFCQQRKALILMELL